MTDDSSATSVQPQDDPPYLGAFGPFALALFAALYLAGAALNAWLDLAPGLSTVLWTPSGLYLAALLLSEARRWPLLAATAFAVDAASSLWLFQFPPLVSVMVALGNSLEALIGAYLVRRRCGAPFRFASARDVLWLALLAALLSSIVSATIGAATVAGAGLQPFATAWPLWWVSDAVGVLIVAPLALVAVQGRLSLSAMDGARRAEAATILCALVAGCYLIFSGRFPFTYMILPVLLWAALRFGMPGAAVAMAIITVFAVGFTEIGQGMFALAAVSPETRALLVQLFLGTFSVSTLVLAAAISQRTEAQRAAQTAYDALQQRSAALRESQAFAQAVVDGQRAHIAILDRDGKIIAVNRRWREFAAANHGLPAAVGVGADYLAVCDASKMSGLANGIRDLLQGKPVEVSFEYPCATPTGERWFTMRAAALTGAGPGRVVIAHDDITGRKLTEQLLRESEERLWLAKSAAGLGAFDHDMVSGKIRWDEIVRRWWGEPPEREITQERAFAALHPDDVAPTLAVLEKAADPAGDGRYEVEYRVLNPFDGVTRWIAVAGQTMFAQGRAVRRVGTVQDVSARKAAEASLRDSEERLQLAKSAAGLGIFDANLVSGDIDWDATIRRWWGVGPDVRINRQALLEQVHPDDRGATLAAFERADDPTGDGTFNIEYRVINRSDGQMHWVASAGQSVYADGRAVRRIGTVQDITARKAAEAALRDSEERLRLARTATGLGVFDANLVSDEINWDATIRRWWGVGLDDRINRQAVLEQIHPDDRDATRAAFEAADHPAGDGTFNIEFRVVNRNDGQMRWVASAGQTVFADGRAVRRVGTVQDITARKKAEAELRASEERLSLAYAAAGFGSFEYDLISGQIRWDAPIYDWWGLPRDRPVILATVMEGIHPDDLARLKTAHDQAADPASDGRYSVEYRVINRQDGVTRWIAGVGRTFFDQGRAVRRIGMLQDVTARKAAEASLRDSEERLQIARTAAGLGVYDNDFVNNELRWDARVREIWGLNRDERITRGLIHSLVHEDDWAVRQGAIERSRDPAGDGHYQAEYRIVRRDGSTRWVAAVGQTFFAHGSPVRSVGVFQDITARKTAEAELRASEERLSLANAAAGFGSVEHNLVTGEAIWDATVRDWWGVAPDERVTQELALSAIHQDDRAGMLAVLEQAADPAGDGRYSIEYRVINRRDGATRWIAGAGRTFFDQGRAVRRISLLQDITARKWAEAALRESEERLRLARSAAGLGIYDIDLVSGELRWDERIRELWGVSPDEKITRELSMSALPEEDLATTHAALARAYDPNGDGRYEAEYRVINRQDGVTRWVAAVGQVFFANGRAVRLVGAAQDISDRKAAEQALRASEERLQLASEASGAGIYDHDLLHGRIGWDARLRELWGLAPDQQLAPDLLRAMVHPDDLAARDAAIARSHDPAGPGRYHAEYRIVRPDGATRWLAVLGRVFFANGVPVRTVGVSQDITAHKEAEAALARANAELETRIAERTAELRESEQRMRALVELSSDWYWEQDENFRYVSVSGDRRPFDRGAAGYIGKARWETPEFAAGAASLAAHRAQLERHEPFRDFEFQGRSKEGALAWISSSGDPVFDASGRFIGYRGVGRDITAYKLAQEEVARAKERLELALQASNEMIFESDLRADRIYLFGSPIRGGPGATAEVTLAQALEAVHPDDVGRVQRGDKALREGTTSQISFEYRLRLPTGEWSWRLLRGRVTQRDPATGRALRAAGTSVDITELKRAEQSLFESEERLRLAKAAAGFGIFDRDLIAGARRWDARCRELWGFAPDITITDEMVLSCVHPDDLSLYLAIQDKGLDPAGDGPTYCEYRITSRADGVTRWIATATRVFFENGRAVRAVGTLLDVSAYKQAEAAQAALAHAQRMEAVGQLTGGLAHDMNNLLTIVLGNLDLADRRIADEDSRDLLRRARDAVTVGANLNRRLLTFARQRKLDPVLLELDDRVLEMAELLRRTLGSPVTLKVRLAEEAWPTRVDPGEVDHAILNLAINARDAMPNGGTLTISTDNVTLDAAAAAGHSGVRAGDFVRLSVTDTGVGMSAEVRRRAVEPFFSTKEVGKGTGLGLSSVYGFAKLSGGFLAIDSEPDKGATVSVYLPRALDSVAAAIPRSRDEEPVGAGESVLVVEDNYRVSEVVTDQLKGLGYAVQTSRTGPEAIGLLESGESFALVLSDVVMPGGMSGYDVARWVRARRPEVRILLTSGYSEGAGPIAAEELNSIRVLSKPYSRAQLARAVRTALAE